MHDIQNNLHIVYTIQPVVWCSEIQELLQIVEVVEKKGERVK